ncbi:MFS transporter [Noviherbaspirillum sp.]|uniref:MFS transporter n=1 Tax=Noviherbaspirillum sp. TaxID=1926288 RepID=UPI0025E5DA68|nr:MFS transporter [Noviherbaspirillum sp.]
MPAHRSSRLHPRSLARKAMPISGSLSVNRTYRVAASTLFFVLGMVFATWAARIPAIRDGLQLDAAELGVVLLCGGGGSVVCFPIAAWLVGRFGSRQAAWYTGLVLVSVLPALAAAPNMVSLMMLMVVLGASQTSFNVAINTIGSELEKTTGRSVLSSLHAWYCVGSLAGAVLGSLLAGAGLAVTMHFSAITLLLLLMLFLSCRVLPNDSPAAADRKNHFVLPKGPLLALGVICHCVAIAEGAITDWSSIYMRDELAATEGIAPLAYAAFSAVMLGARLYADRAKDRFGARSVVAAGALLATAGIAIVVMAFNLGTTIVGFALTGAGLAAVFPFVFSAAGKRGPTALAAVATMGYSGILIGPPVIGFIAHAFGLQAAFAFIGLTTISIALVAIRARVLN